MVLIYIERINKLGTSIMILIGNERGPINVNTGKDYSTVKFNRKLYKLLYFNLVKIRIHFGIVS